MSYKIELQELQRELADIKKAGYEIGEDENGKFLARKLKRKVDKVYLYKE